MKNGYMKVSSYEGKEGKVKKVVLLYSGGLDTSCILKWIQDKYRVEVIAVCMDLGQQADDLQKIKEKALKLGAVKVYVLDVKDEFAEQYISKLIKANGSYQGDYHISTISRYIMAKKAIEIAGKEGADAIAHGCTGKGNDQVRIEATALALKPDIKIIAPVREWAMGRDEEIEYAKKHGIEVLQTEEFPYSSDDNMWGVTWEGGEIEDNYAVPKISKFLNITLPENAPDKPEYIEIGFEEGIPVSIKGKKMKLAELIIELNKIGKKHGIGLVYMVEDRLVGLKVRGVYEHPGAHIIIEAHKKLELFVCTRAEDYFPQESFDVILAFKTFCWIETKDILRICINSLKKKGFYITNNEISYYLGSKHNREPLCIVSRHETNSKLFKKSGKTLYVYNYKQCCWITSHNLVSSKI